MSGQLEAGFQAKQTASEWILNRVLSFYKWASFAPRKQKDLGKLFIKKIVLLILTKHNAYTSYIILKNEDPASFQKLHKGALWSPVTSLASPFLEEITYSYTHQPT